ncbi:MAG: SET domain-containing protein-lysine N-methyltransferase [Magnetospirillum sp.]|nr:SET domain-containing protein-lysine N-methyltransferase [Magnetospirillum sp.]
MTTPLYPSIYQVDDELPVAEDFTVTSVKRKVGMGVKSVHAIPRGVRVAKFTGQLSSKVLQHTLQVSPDAHLHDPYFVGLLTHSCAPNCVLDMQRLEIWSLSDIKAGDLLTIDYAVTEDVLHRQFACGCGSSHCRRWITGRREGPNEIGVAYLEGLAAKKIKRLATMEKRRSSR